MKNILVSISYSELTAVTLIYAFKLAQYFEAEITVAHIVEPKDAHISDVDLLESKMTNEEIEERRKAHRAEKEAELKATINRYYSKQYHDITVKFRLEYGYSAEELTRLAEELNSDLLVVGVPKRKLADRLTFVNKPMQFAETVSCPVLTVPISGGFNGINRIVYASDFMLEDVADLWFLEEWMQVFKAKLLCVHICQTEKEKSAATRRMQILQKLFPGNQFEFLIEVGNVPDLLDNVLELNRADIIAVLKRRKTLWQSIVRPNIIGELAKDIWIPLLIFKQP